MSARPNWFPAIMGLLAVIVLLLHFSATGFALTWDTAAYAHAAQTLLRGEGFLIINNEQMISWPPMYPLLLAIATLGVFDPVAVVAPLNVMFFALTIFVLAAFLNRRIRNKLVATSASLCALLAWPMVWAGSHGWSETTFMFFATVALVQADEYRRGAMRALWWSAAFTALACLTRYMGVAVLTAIALLLVVQGPRPFRQRLRAVVTYVAMTAAPLGAWLVRNALLAGGITNEWTGKGYDLYTIVDATVAGLEDWLTGGFPVAILPTGVTTAMLALCCTAFVGLTIGTALCLRQRRSAWDRQAIVLFGLFVLVYLNLFITMMSTGIVWFGVQARYLLPIYLPLLILIALVVDGALEARKRRTCNTRAARGARELPLAVVGCLGAAPAWQLALNIDLAHSDRDLGYGSDRFHASATLLDARLRGLTGTLYTNDAAATFLHMPRSRLTHRYLACDFRSSFFSRTNVKGEVHVLWLYDPLTVCLNSSLPELEAVLNTAGLEPVAESSDGLLWRFNPTNLTAIPALAWREPQGELIHSAKFKLFLSQNTVTYFKQPCTRADTEDRFFAHLTPMRTSDLPHQMINLDFDFSARGLFRSNGACVVRIALPDYAPATLRTGQFAGDELWEATIELPGG